MCVCVRACVFLCVLCICEDDWNGLKLSHGGRVGAIDCMKMIGMAG